MNELAQLLSRARSLAREGRLVEAVPHCRRILELDPHRAEPRLLLGLAAAQQRQPEEAAEHLGCYLQARPGDPQAWYNLGVVRQQQGRPEEAMAAYRKVLELAPGTVAARVNLAVLLRGAGRVAEALPLLEQVPEGADPRERGQLHAEHARALESLGRHREAVGQWQQALGLLPQDAGLAVSAAAALHRCGRGQVAETALREVLARQPERADAWNVLGVVLAARGQRAAAAEAARKAVDHAPHNAAFQYNLAAVLSKRTDRDELRASADAAAACLALQPGHADAHHCLGLVLAKLDQGRAAVSSLARALELAPERADFPVALADQLAGLGEFDQAVAVLEKAARQHPGAGDVHRQLGIHRLKRQDPAAALEALDRALEIAPSDQRTIAHRAVALQALGRHDEAGRWLGIDRHLQRRQLAPPPGFDSLDAFNRSLGQDIRNHSLLRWEPMGLAARNGALTEELLADRTPAILGFAQRLREAIESLRTAAVTDPNDPFLRSIPGPDYELNIWATLVEGGGNIDTHIHEESWLSGAYYVALPPQLGSDVSDPAGWIEFGRPHSAVPWPEDARVELIQPQEGLLILFPSYLFHRTVPHRGGGQRISISFDLVPQ